MVAQNEKTMGMLAHLLAIFTGFIGPLILFLVGKDKKGFAHENAKHALNFQISVAIYSIVSLILIFVLIGIPLIIAVSIFNLVVCIIGSIKAYEGNVYKYPLEILFIK